MLIHKAKQKSVLWSAGVVNEPIVNKGGRARAAWLKLGGSVKINHPIQHLFSIEAKKSGLDRTEELTKQQKLREEKSRSEVSIPPVSNPFFLDQPVADEVVAVQPSPPRKQMVLLRIQFTYVLCFAKDAKRFLALRYSCRFAFVVFPE